MRINGNMNSIRLISILLLVTKDSEDKNNYIKIIGYFSSIIIQQICTQKIVKFNIS